MPRRKQRFSKLFDQLRGVGGTPTGTGETTEFFRYLTGQRKIIQTNTIPIEARKLYEVALLPFALSASTPDAANRYKTTMSAYSIAGLANRVEATEADLGIFRIVGGEQENENYFPALIKAKYAASGVAVQENRESGVTGRNYRYEYGRTFSLPFGRNVNAKDAKDGADITSVDAADELDVLKTVQDKIKSGTGTKEVMSLSYDAEVFKDAASGTPLEATTTVTGITVS